MCVSPPSSQGENEYLGKTVVVPTVRLSMDTAAPRLDWYGIERYTSYAGELLGAFELLLVSALLCGG